MALGSDTGIVSIWDLATGERVTTCTGQETAFHALAFNPDGSRIAAAGDDGAIRLWNAEDGKYLLTFTGHESSIYSVAFSPDGHRITSGGDDGTVRVWDSETGNCLLNIPNCPGLFVHGVAMNPLDPDSNLNPEEREILRLYGARLESAE